MTNKDKAQALWGILGDETKPLAERLAARTELLEVKRAAKTSLPKLLGDLVADQHDVDALMDADLSGPIEVGELAAVLEAASGSKVRVTPTPGGGGCTVSVALKPGADPLDEPAAPKLTAPIVEAQEAGEPLPSGSRGLISAEVRRLLRDTDLPYSAIVEEVKGKFPEASTSTRSCASVASELRGKGEAIPTRRGVQA